MGALRLERLNNISRQLFSVNQDFLDPYGYMLRIFHANFISRAAEEPFHFESAPFLGNAGINLKPGDCRMDSENVVNHNPEKPSR